jgi:hypothetical protein
MRKYGIYKRHITFKSWLLIHLETYCKVGKNEKCKDFANHIDAMLFFFKLNILKTHSILLYVKRKAVVGEYRGVVNCLTTYKELIKALLCSLLLIFENIYLYLHNILQTLMKIP